MGKETINTGALELEIPTVGTRNWAGLIRSGAWSRISDHDHTGSPKGNKLTAASLADGSIVTASLADRAVTSVKLAENIAAVQFDITNPTGANPAITVDWDNGRIQRIDFESASGTPVLTLSNPLSGATYHLIITQSAGPIADITWPASVLWPQGQKPILSTTDNAVDKIKLYYDGTNYLGDWNLDYK